MLDAFETQNKGLRTLSKEDLTGHKQKKEHFVKSAKNMFFQKPLFLGKANLKGSLETQGINENLVKSWRLLQAD